MDIHFEWDRNKAASNLRKHGVSFIEASEIFNDPLAIKLRDDEHSEQEERWVTIGQVRSMRIVVTVHTWQEDDDNIYVRIISARKATVHEIKNYEG
ncbi:BrnT family toxin [Cellvibrio sp. OA-2007]|uniref:BrnT family toxin n=1 Tax=Cellvibrio sp. OA-2007 TaxID=529823 RepID=UPI000786660D|nr:BrnT family toxin [Cellvibrio sp. OA-2007]